MHGSFPKGFSITVLCVFFVLPKLSASGQMQLLSQGMNIAYIMLTMLLLLLLLDCRACVQGDHFVQNSSFMSSSREYEKALQLRRDVVQELADSRE